MPRGGPPTYTYTLPAVYLAVPGTTILATQHNSPLEDIASVLNDPWPVNLGGTGGTSIITAWDSLNSRGPDVPTSSTVDLDTTTGANVHLTGTTTVTSVLLSNGRMRTVVADSAFVMTAGASLYVDGYTSGDRSIAAGTILLFVGGSAGVVYVSTAGNGATSLFGYTTTATAAGTTTLTAASTYQQYFTGSTTQTVQLPVTSTLVLGQSYRIVNNSTGVVTVNSSGGNAVVSLPPGTLAVVTCILLSGTAAASWAIAYIPAVSNVNGPALSVPGTASNPGYVELYEQTTNGSNKVIISPPAAVTADRFVGLPDADLALNNITSSLSAFSPLTNDAMALGTTSLGWSDAFFATGAVLNWANGDVTITHSSNLLAFAGASSGYSFDAAVKPSSNDAAALGVSGTAWADLFLASGGVINWNAGDVTITHSADALAFAGAANGYSFDKTIIFGSVGSTGATIKATQAYTLSNGNNAILDVGSGRLVINDHGSGQVAEFLIGGGISKLVAQTSTQFVDTSPGAGQVGVFWNGVDKYYIGNNKGSTLTYGMILEFTRSTV